MKRSLITLTIVSIFLALYLIGCGGGDGVSTITPSVTGNDGLGSLEITVPWPEEGSDISAQLIQSTVKSIKIECQNSSGGTENTFTINKPSAGYTIPTVQKFDGVKATVVQVVLSGMDSADGNGNMLSNRIKKVTITAGQTTPINAYLGVTIKDKKFIPSTIPVSPGDTLYWGNMDSTAYKIKFSVNGNPVVIDVAANAQDTDANAAKYTFPDSIASVATVQLYTSDDVPVTGGTGSFDVQLPGGQKYAHTGTWGYQSAYDANYGSVFVASDQDCNFYVAVYDPYSSLSEATDNVDYAQRFRNHIEKYDSAGNHLTSQYDGGFLIDTTGVIQIAGLAVDPAGEYIYITDANYDDGANADPGEGAYDTTNGLGGRVIRFLAKSSSSGKDLGHPNSTLGYSNGFNFGEINGLATSSDGKWLYVPEFYQHWVRTGADTYEPRFVLHRCNLANQDTPKWNDPTTLPTNDQWPVNLEGTSSTASVDYRIVQPVGVAAGSSGNVYVAGTIFSTATCGRAAGYVEPNPPINPLTDQRIVVYSAEGVRASRLYPPAAIGIGNYPDINFITGIAAYNVPSQGGSVVEAIFAADYDWTDGHENECVYKYDGAKWLTTPFRTSFTIPCPVDGTPSSSTALVGGGARLYPAGQALPYVYANFNAPYNVNGGVAQALTVAVCPNQTQEVFVGDAYHRVWKFNQAGKEMDRWRLLYKDYANPAGTATDKNGNVYIVDNVNCRVIKSKTLGVNKSQYITQWGTPPFLAVYDAKDLMNWYNAYIDHHRLEGTLAIPPSGTAGDYPTQQIASTINIAGDTSLSPTFVEYYYPWGIAVDNDKDIIYVVDWARNPNPGPTSSEGFNYSVGRVSKLQPGYNVTSPLSSNIVHPLGVEWYQGVQRFFWYPTGISYGKAYVWVADTYSNGIQLNSAVPAYGDGEVHKFKEDGTPLITLLGAENKGFFHPWGLATDATNNIVYVSDTENDRVLAYDLETSNYIKQVSTAGTVGTGGAGKFHTCVGCYLDKGNNLYVVDGFNRRMQKNLVSGGGWIEAWDTNNLFYPLYTSVDINGKVYTTDNHRVKLYEATN